MSTTETMIAMACVAYLAYRMGELKARTSQASQSAAAVQADPLAWLTGWAQ